MEDRPDIFFFQVLKHPQDAFDNRPRGKRELLEIFRSMDFQSGDVVVTDCWKGTIAAVSALKQEYGWSDVELRHETCNHAQGQIVNDNGYSTNQIENKWSVLKRWARKRHGGKLPHRKDRQGWTNLLGEFKLRKYFQYAHGTDASDVKRFVIPFLREWATSLAE